MKKRPDWLRKAVKRKMKERDEGIESFRVIFGYKQLNAGSIEGEGMCEGETMSWQIGSVKSTIWRNISSMNCLSMIKRCYFSLKHSFMDVSVAVSAAEDLVSYFIPLPENSDSAGSYMGNNYRRIQYDPVQKKKLEE